MENIGLLKKFFLFKGLSGMDLVRITRIVVRHAYPQGTLIIEEGSVGDSLFIVKSGRVRVFNKDRRRRKVTLALLNAGDHLGEVSLFDRGPRSASVEAVADCELLEIAGDDLARLLSGNDTLAVKLYKNFVVSLCHRLRRTNLLISERGDRTAKDVPF